MPRLKGGEAVIEALMNEGVEVIFGIPGVHTLEIYDALYHRPQMGHIVARHEQGATFMADGYARVSGKTGVVIANTGPGVTNAATGIAQAYADGSPLLVISSEVDSRHRGKGNLHELKDQLGMLKAITVWNARAESVGEIPRLIHEAMQRIWGGWPGPAHVEIPIDVLADQADVTLPERGERKGKAAPQETVQQVVEHLRVCERPIILAGWGVTLDDANGELLALAERLQAPVIATPVGKGVIPGDHPLALGAGWRQDGVIAEIVKGSDLCLAVGTRMGAMETRSWALPLPKRLIHIDPDPENIGRCYETEIALLGHPKAVLGQILAELGAVTKAPRVDSILAARQESAAVIAEGSPQMQGILADLRSALDAGAILSMDPTLPAYWATSYLPVPRPRAMLNPYNLMTLGFGLPAGIGAAIAEPERPVVVLCGDGGFMFTVQELATAVKYDLNLKIVLANNDCFGAIRRNQERRFEGRVIDAELTNPDFCALARAFGIQAVRLDTPSDLGMALDRALETRGLCLIEVPIHELPAPW